MGHRQNSEPGNKFQSQFIVMGRKVTLKIFLIIQSDFGIKLFWFESDIDSQSKPAGIYII